MSEAQIIEAGMAFLGTLFSLIWALLKQKDSAQAGQIADLYAKHDLDAAELVKLKVKVAALKPPHGDEQ